MTILTMSGDRIAVAFPFSEHGLQLIRAVPGRRWAPERKHWTVPAERVSLEALRDGFGLTIEQFPREVRHLLNGYDTDAGRWEPAAEELASAELAWRSVSLITPYRHQVHALAELLTHNRWLLAHEMGLGKTAVVCVRLRLGLDDNSIWGPILIVCPKSVIPIWPEQLQRHAQLGGQTVIFDTSIKPDSREHFLSTIGDRAIVVTNYELVVRYCDEFARRNWQCVISDESHRQKHTTTQTSKAMRHVSRDAKYRYALTGTPAPNGPLDVFGTLTFLDPNITGTSSWITFRARHAVLENKDFGGRRPVPVVVGYRDLATLEAQVASCSSRVKKEDALDLPPKTFVARPCPLSPEQHRVYGELKRQAVARLRAREGDSELMVRNILSETLRLLQVCGGHVPDDEGRMHHLDCGKLTVFEEMCEDFALDQKVLVWASFHAEVDALRDLLGGRADGFDGRTLLALSRQAAIDRFRQDPACQFFISTPAAGGEGISLTEASTVVYYSRDWNLKNYLQSQDRCHRIGQNYPVTIYNLVCPGTVDEHCLEALSRKETLQELVMRGAWKGLFE